MKSLKLQKRKSDMKNNETKIKEGKENKAVQPNDT